MMLRNWGVGLMILCAGVSGTEVFGNDCARNLGNSQMVYQIPFGIFEGKILEELPDESLRAYANQVLLSLVENDMEIVGLIRQFLEKVELYFTVRGIDRPLLWTYAKLRLNEKNKIEGMTAKLPMHLSRYQIENLIKNNGD